MRKRHAEPELTEEQKATRAAALAERQREEKVRRIRCGMKRSAAVEFVARTLREARLRGLRVHSYPAEALAGEPLHEHTDSVSVEVERGWGVGCRLEVRFRRAFDRDEWGREGDVALMPCRVEVDLGWSSAGRDIATATARIALYRELTELGAEINAAFNYGVYIEEPWKW